METITSRENAKIKYACKLAQSAAFRSGEKSFFAEGLKLCLELAKGTPLKVIYYTQRALDKAPELAALSCPQFLVEDHVAEKLAGTKTSQGVFGVFQTPETCWRDVPVTGHILALENVQDPGNVGALIRSAAAFGYDAVVLSASCASPYAPKTLRSAMGAAVRVPVVTVADLPAALTELRRAGCTCLAAALYNSRPLDELDGKLTGGVCVVIGSEGQGLTEESIAACSVAVRIPITDKVESLNAGVAGSVLLWQLRKGN